MSLKNCNFKNNIRCHSGGAEGADTYFEKISTFYNIKTIAYSYQTAYHTSVNKYELSEKEYIEGIAHVNTANETLKKYRLKSYLKLYARCWFQVKNAEQLFAISTFIQIENKQFVKGGTGVTVQMAIDNDKEVFVFEQELNQWFFWDYSNKKFNLLSEIPKITTVDFAGIGSRSINEKGIKAIESLFRKTFQ